MLLVFPGDRFGKEFAANMIVFSDGDMLFRRSVLYAPLDYCSNCHPRFSRVRRVVGTRGK
jgi:hypothetical protein